MRVVQLLQKYVRIQNNSDNPWSIRDLDRESLLNGPVTVDLDLTKSSRFITKKSKKNKKMQVHCPVYGLLNDEDE